MLFNSIQYAAFLLIVFFIYWLLPAKHRWALLVVSSYYFYMSWEIKYGILLLLVTVITYLGARLIENTTNIRRKIYFISLLSVCLGILFIFKYLNFTLNSFTLLFSVIGLKFSPITYNVILPIGISFYIFQTISYLIDVYKENIRAEKHFGLYAAYVSFFPKLAEGPIERASKLLQQLKENKIFCYEQAVYGLRQMLWGFFKKLAIADVLSKYVDLGYKNLSACTNCDIYLLVFFYAIQIYCDFSGYSDIAIGSAKLLGIDLTTNFKSPYFAKNVKEFWSRWHISLSTWFRDYVYIPLGGNRCSKLKNYFNLLITFLVSGLWHGADWTFVLWGGLHGIGQVIEKMTGIYKHQSGKIVRALSVIVTFIFCSVCWVFFRAESINDAVYVIGRVLSSFRNGGIYLSSNIGVELIDLLKVAVCISIVCIFDYKNLNVDVLEWISTRKNVVRWAIYIIMIWLIWFMMPLSGSTEFVYFQF